MLNDIGLDNETRGQPKWTADKEMQKMRLGFSMGKLHAGLTQTKKQNEQDSQLNLMQKMMLQEQQMQFQQEKMSLLDLISELQRNQADMNAKLEGALPPAAPPLPPDAGPPMPGGMPPLPMEGGMPPDMGGGMPPPEMDPNAMGGMPPPGMPPPGQQPPPFA